MRSRRLTIFAVCLATLLLALAAVPWAGVAKALDENDYDDGIDNTIACDDFRLGFETFLGDVSIQDRSDEGWVWVAGGAERFQEVSGVATRAKVSARDTAANHYSHDFNVDVLVDEGQERLVSVIGHNNEGDLREPDTIEVEWETGTRPDEHRGDGQDPFFPKWAWPSVGDRVWAGGNWVYDCGHADKETPPFPCHFFPKASECEGQGEPVSRFRAEIHPARAIASMRDQSRTMPGSGTTPVPVTATDLYIHGRGGFMVEQLYCGMDIILTGERCDRRTTPIAEEYELNVCLPLKPFGTARLGTLIRRGPGNTVGDPEPELDLVESSAACRKARWPGTAFEDVPKFDQDKMLRVRVDLSGSGAPDAAVYARRIYAGWVFPPSPPLRHFRVALNEMDLENDKDRDPGDCECTFFWLNVNTAEAQGNPVENEWIRLQDYTEADMDNYDDWHGPGDGEIEFSGADFEFYPRNLHAPAFDEQGHRFLQFTNLIANGYDRDCNDMRLMGHFKISVPAYVDCFLGRGAFELEPGREDEFPTRLLQLGSSTFHGIDYPGQHTLGTSDDEYALDFTVDEIPPAQEDEADVGVTKSCSPDGEVAVPDEPFTCTIEVSNAGPGLPRALTLHDSLATSLAADEYTIDSASFTIGDDPARFPCEIAPPNELACDLGTVPVGDAATVTVEITPEHAGTLTNRGELETDSADPDLADNHAEATIEVFQPVEVDIKPGDEVNPINPRSHGVVPVAVLGTEEFDATTINPLSVCFGDAEEPTERACTEAHLTGHHEDVNGDGLQDLLLHYRTEETGIDAGDARACLKGETLSGAGVYGCDAVRTE